MSSISSSSYRHFSYWFQDTILDNNGESVSDINAGIVKLIPDTLDKINDVSNSISRFIVPDCQIGMPDVAAKCFYYDENMWWYICYGNLLMNPFTEYTNNLMYFTVDEQIIEDQDINLNNQNVDNKSKIGTIIELN